MNNNKNDTLWTSGDIAKITGGTATGNFEAMGVSIDTRTLKTGDIYIALKGESLDGHDYVESAFKAGATAALVKKDFQAKDPSWTLVHVDDTLKALEDLGKAARARATGKIIGVTGSAGKTGTKEMLLIALSALGKSYASKKSFNNHWGVPLSLSNLPPDADYGIFEMGMNHAGELEKLTAQVRPHIAIVTTVEAAHIENFKNVDAIADAKAEIFTGMDKNGIAILNNDNPHHARLKNAAEAVGISRILSFGEEEKTDAHLVDCTLHADSSKVTADISGERVKYKLNVPGKHIVINSLAALLAVRAAGGDLQTAVEAIKNSEPVEGRGNRLTVTMEDGQPPVIIIDESYNANPASMRASFSVFEMVAPKGAGRRIAVLGDMLELGRDGPRLHAELANPLLKAKTDLLFCCGPQMDALYQTLPEHWRGGHAPDSKALAELVTQAVQPGDVILVKGSAGSKMAYIVEALQCLRAPTGIKEQRNVI